MLIGNHLETGVLPVGPKGIPLYTLLFNSFTGGKPDMFLLLKLIDDKWISKEASKGEERGKRTQTKEPNRVIQTA